MRGLGCVGFNNLDMLEEDDRAGKGEDDRWQMRRDQQCVSRGPGIIGWRSLLALTLTQCHIYAQISFLELAECKWSEVPEQKLDSSFQMP